MEGRPHTIIWNFHFTKDFAKLIFFSNFSAFQPPTTVNFGTVLNKLVYIIYYHNWMMGVFSKWKWCGTILSKNRTIWSPYLKCATCISLAFIWFKTYFNISLLMFTSKMIMLGKGQAANLSTFFIIIQCNVKYNSVTEIFVNLGITSKLHSEWTDVLRCKPRL